jgi:hypothetical protein
MRTSSARALFIAACLGLQSFACGGPTAPEVSYDGTWVGQTNEGGRVQLIVAANTVVRFEMDVALGPPGSNCGFFVFNNVGQPLSPPATIAGQNFVFEFGGAFGSSEKTAITGTFTSARRMTGTYGAFTVSVPSRAAECATTVKAPGTFFAEQ